MPIKELSGLLFRPVLVNSLLRLSDCGSHFCFEEVLCAFDAFFLDVDFGHYSVDVVQAAVFSQLTRQRLAKDQQKLQPANHAAFG